MTPSNFLRTASLTALAVLFLGAGAESAPSPAVTVQRRLAALESSSGGRLGVAALGGTAPVLYRADERFPFCSTFKVMLASAILKRAETEVGLLERKVLYSQDDVVSYSPISGRHAGEGMVVERLCAAAMQYSDNTAANVLIRELGGPSAVTSFARAIGDDRFRLDRRETDLNTAIPGDPRDTTTPVAMARSLQRLALGDALSAPSRDKLNEWLRGNTTGGARIRAGVPATWAVGDKTGTGDYGTTNDIAVLRPPGQAPIILVVYLTQRDPHAEPRNDVIAEAARIVAESLPHPTR